MKKVITILVVVIFLTTSINGIVLAGEPIEKPIEGKFHYVPESDMTRVTFSMKWILENDMDENPNSVKINFPKTWIIESPFQKEEGSVELAVPTELLEFNNYSEIPEDVYVTFPNAYFIGLPEVPLPSVPIKEELAKLNIKSGTKQIDYLEQHNYSVTDNDDPVKGARGSMAPSVLQNPDDETFLTYHEIEFRESLAAWGADGVEVILMTVEDDYDKQEVMFAYYNENAYWPNYYCSHAIGSGDSARWEWYINYQGVVNFLIRDANYMWLVSDTYTDGTPPPEFTIVIGSSELESRGGIAESFFVYSVLTLDDLYAGGSWHGSSYVNQRLDWIEASDPMDYVGIYTLLNSSYLYVGAYAMNKQYHF